jgi:hypothetical protein
MRPTSARLAEAYNVQTAIAWSARVSLITALVGRYSEQAAGRFTPALRS